MLASQRRPAVAYLNEPFNIRQPRGLFPSRPPFWFPYICAENAREVRADIAHLLASRYAAFTELRDVRSAHDLGRLGRDVAMHARDRLRSARPLMKDPIAVFSSEWLCETFSMDVVISARHPCGFAASLMRLGWTHPFDHFLRQPLLMRDHLARFEDEIRWFAACERPIVEQAALLWKLVYATVATLRARHPGWSVVRLEDLADAPVQGFAHLARRVDLSFSPDIRAAVIASSASSNPVATSGSSNVFRHSSAAVQAWRTRLSRADVRTIGGIVGDAARGFYDDV
jgi:hypothetical protein